MIEMMKATAGGSRAARRAQQQHALMLRQAVGFAIVTSGLVVVAAQALQHAIGG
ncbi:hypothetical protein [Paraburkholderia rhynchosiae]|uniref:Uncharacterized protein n=1 Tax=Paraburkholderia rhynchosiae TaxID=487049 RepID=A0A6J5A8V1_9BURK|nr:hypothetical protein [Paraburkholderia rhynchosiae]CAB3639438.1 hypothetical protein LMG27174_00397 [Paraburkholderia rhynchosiae]